MVSVPWTDPQCSSVHNTDRSVQITSIEFNSVQISLVLCFSLPLNCFTSVFVPQLCLEGFYFINISDFSPAGVFTASPLPFPPLCLSFCPTRAIFGPPAPSHTPSGPFYFGPLPKTQTWLLLMCYMSRPCCTHARRQTHWHLAGLNPVSIAFYQ